MTILGFAGRIGSGKSTISRMISQILGWPCLSFGDCVRTIAKERGLSVDRESLQKLGQSLIDTDCEGFCKRVLSSYGNTKSQSVVVDGIRHTKVINTLKQLINSNDFVLIFVDTPENILLKRLDSEKNLNKKQLKELESHATEAEVNNAIRGLADLIVDGSKPVNDICEELVVWLKQKLLD